MGGRGHTGPLPRLAKSPSRSNGRALASTPPAAPGPEPPAAPMAVKKNRTLAANCQPPTLARLEGFEPPTRGLEGRCSVQLSYRRKRRD